MKNKFIAIIVFLGITSCQAAITSHGWQINTANSRIEYKITGTSSWPCTEWYYLGGYFTYSNGHWQRGYYDNNPSCLYRYCSGGIAGCGCNCYTQPRVYDLEDAEMAALLLSDANAAEIMDVYFPDGIYDANTAQKFEALIQVADAAVAEANAPHENKINTTEKADPVYLSNGEYALTTTDFIGIGRKLPVEITRAYGSKREHNSQFGYGWDMSYNIKLRRLIAYNNEPNTVVLLDGSGYKREYVQDVNDPGKYVRLDDLDGYIEDANGILALVKKSGITYSFDESGNLSQIKDLNGNTVSLSYNPSGPMPIYGPSPFFNFEFPYSRYGLIAKEYQLTAVTDDLGRQIQFTYKSNGLINTITDFANRTWTYTHDASTNDLISVQDPNGLITAYSYDPYHNLLTITDPNSQTYLTNNYDLYDRVDMQVYGDGYFEFDYDPNNSKSMLINRQNHESLVVYNAAGQIVSDTTYTDDTAAEPNQFTTSYQYNVNNQVVRTILSDGNSIDFTYNTAGNLTGAFRKANIDDPNDANDSNVIGITYTYDTNFPNKIRTMRDPEGEVTTYSYDSKGNLVRITYPQVPTASGLETPIIEFTYNTYGQVDTATSADGIVTKYVYGTSGNGYGKLWKVITDYGTGGGYLNLTTEYGYDSVGNVTSITDPNGNTTQTTYNVSDLPTQITSPSPFSYVTTLAYNKNKKLAAAASTVESSSQVTKYSYDKLDNLTTITDPLNHTTRYGYTKNEEPNIVTDAESHSTKSQYDERGLVSVVTDANGSQTKYRYNVNGNLSELEDAHGNITSYYYDAFGRLSCVTYPDDTNETFTYDKNSNVITAKKQGGDVFTFTYDALNRTLSKTVNNEPNTTYLYDRAGKLLEVDDAGEITTYTYDHIGRVIAVLNPENANVSYGYDELGRRTKLVYPDGSFIQYKYDTLSRLTDILDDANNVIAHYGYDALSRRTSLAIANDVNTTYSYDLANRLTYINNSVADVNDPNRNWQRRFDYTHDNVGNRLTMTVNLSDLYNFDYDVIYQLIAVDYPAGGLTDTAYNYDALGNRISVIDSATTNYNQNTAGLNQYGSVGSATYSYDNNGNLINDGSQKYYYDAENHLTDVNTVADVRIAHYTYDYKGRRVSKTDHTQNPARSTLFAYDGDQIIAEYDNTAALSKKYIYGPGIDEPVCMIDVADNNVVYYYHFDGLGSVVALSNEGGELVESYSYDVFGQPNTISTIGNCFMFTGREYDSETGLYHYRARAYKPSMGRFLQTDPMGYGDSINMYSYCGNNPVSWADPYGLCKGDKYQDWWASYIGAIGNLAGWLNTGIHVGLDVAGVFDPTGIADFWNAAGYAGEGNWAYAGVSTAGLIPYVGDAAKGVKYGTKAVKAAKKSSKAIRKEWEHEMQQPWPKDPKTGGNQDVSHINAKADGGTDDLSNIEPKPHSQHMEDHINNGDFQRWGARSRGVGQ